MGLKSKLGHQLHTFFIQTAEQPRQDLQPEIGFQTGPLTVTHPIGLGGNMPLVESGHCSKAFGYRSVLNLGSGRFGMVILP